MLRHTSNKQHPHPSPLPKGEGANSGINQYLRSPTLWLIASAILCLPFADLSIYTAEPWQQLQRISWGFITPSYNAELLNADSLLESFFNTLAFALQGVALGIVGGFALSLFQHQRLVRSFSAFIRAIHELFWALLFMQLFGLSSLTGVLAIAIPFAGMFAKVFAEHYAHADRQPRYSLPQQRGLSAFVYSTLPLAWPQMRDYIRYRFECGLRSSAILGFIGLPTLGFQLQTFFNEGYYSLSAFLLYGFIVLVLTMRWWLKGILLPIYLLAALIYLPPIANIDASLLWRFISHDIIPAPLRNADVLNADDLQGCREFAHCMEHYAHSLLAGWQWLYKLSTQQILPGTLNTIVLSQLALVVTGGLSLLLFPFISRQFFKGTGRSIGHLILTTLRSTPEYLLAFVGLLMIGPSLLPAIAALGIHTSSIIAHLIGSQSNQLQLRTDASTGINRYFYEVLPRLYPSLMSLLLYRWEIIMRESAILGILGITTLGFYIDSAFEEFRFDRAVLLIVVSALLNIVVDRIALKLRQYKKSPH